MRTLGRFAVQLGSTAVLTLILGGCAATGDDLDGASIPSGGNDCFWARSIHDWRALNDKSLIVWSPSRHCPYRVDVVGHCSGLRFANDIGFQDRDGRICAFGGDAIVIPGPAGGRCTIASVKRIDPEELDRLLGSEQRGTDESDGVGQCSKPSPETE